MKLRANRRQCGSDSENGFLESWKSKSQLFLAEKRAATKMGPDPMGSVRRFCQTVLFT